MVLLYLHERILDLKYGLQHVRLQLFKKRKTLSHLLNFEIDITCVNSILPFLNHYLIQRHQLLLLVYIDVAVFFKRRFPFTLCFANCILSINAFVVVILSVLIDLHVLNLLVWELEIVRCHCKTNELLILLLHDICIEIRGILIWHILFHKIEVILLAKFNFLFFFGRYCFVLKLLHLQL